MARPTATQPRTHHLSNQPPLSQRTPTRPPNLHPIWEFDPPMALQATSDRLYVLAATHPTGPDPRPEGVRVIELQTHPLIPQQEQAGKTVFPSTTAS
ncbi:MAG: hypothetical protein ABWU13_20760 [Limnospira maxima]|nr:hypothetical protein [Limnospira sp. PMC 737.11]MDT9275350.1 hypothetical protein [Limnospira sp. PMC 737.11]MDY7054092.1 hypothetical protein [Limnospira fusiformis LS22]